MAVFYFVFAVLAIILNIGNLPAGIAEIFRMAFSPDAAAGDNSPVVPKDVLVGGDAATEADESTGAPAATAPADGSTGAPAPEAPAAENGADE